MFWIFYIVIGLYTLYFASKFITSEPYAQSYIKNNPKAAFIKKLFGEEKALKLTRSIFAPLGIIIGISFILSGLNSLIR